MGCHKKVQRFWDASFKTKRGTCMFILLEIDFMDNGFQTELIDISYVY